MSAARLLRAAEKYQYHRNQRLLASKGWETATSAISLPDFKVAREAERSSGGKTASEG
jgi:hypothetical protein